MKIGVFTVSLPEYSPEDALQKLAEAGYDGVEWRVTNDQGNRENPSFWSGNRTSMTTEEIIIKADLLRQAAAKNHIEMPSLGAYIDYKNLDAVENHFQAAAAIGAKSIRIGCGGYDKNRGYAEQLSEAREGYACVAALAEKYEVRALIETHFGALTSTIPLAMNVLQGLNPKYTGIMWDPGNEIYEGRERYDLALGIAGEYLGEIHMKNARIVPNMLENGSLRWSTESCQLQLGLVNWPEIFAELKRVGYDGWIMLEDFSTVQPIDERIKSNLAYIRSIL